MTTKQIAERIITQHDVYAWGDAELLARDYMRAMETLQKIHDSIWPHQPNPAAVASSVRKQVNDILVAHGWLKDGVSMQGEGVAAAKKTP